MADIFLTQKGYEQLREELELLKTKKRREIAQTIARARAMGDLSENAEYDAAKEAQGHLEKRIAELEDKLSRARIIENENIPTDKVYIGACVKLRDQDTEEESAYTLVSPAEADYTQNKLSIESPIGKALLGRKAGDVVEIQVPAGILKYRIIEISR
ncbi:MAG: transcription elongation factor GreA [Candidatus Omnitrophota bacterium]|jgi:transcription elongation factor GreA|nr:transcription elongation factor GreA [Candidatus Omnitrophota bacterium]MDD5538372.1 transcription elongation factor GreA [Candidatus Omnitrophota bacterium]